MRDAIYALAGADRARRHRLPPLQYQQEARRIFLAEPLLLGPDRGAGGDFSRRHDRVSWPSACATTRPAPRPTSAACRPGAWSPPRPAWAFSARRWRRACCIFAAPITILHVPAGDGAARSQPLARRCGRRPNRRPRPLTRWWLRFTALLGFAGAGFHAIGVARNMGGWRNWSAEPPGRAAAPRAAGFHRPGAGRPRGARPAGGSSG